MLGASSTYANQSDVQNIDERLKLYEKGQSKAGWKRHVHLNTRTRAELVFWVSRIGKVNGQPFHREAVHRTMDVNLGTDASQPGWGTVITLPPNTPADQSALLRAAQLTLPKNMSVQAIISAVSSGIRICGMFSEAEASESSNARELLATLYSFKIGIGFLRGMRVDHQMDNMGAVQALGGIIPERPDAIFGGSKTSRIQELAIEIDDVCIEANIDRRTFWVPRDLNEEADYMSKALVNDPFAYTLIPHTFARLEELFGHHTIDRFASSHNVLVRPPRYNSLYFESAAESLNAFAVHWRYSRNGDLENNWVHPPYLLISRVIRHIQHCKASATLILPMWTSASWWPDVVPLLTSHPSIDLGLCSDNLFFPAPSRLNHESLPRGHLLALRFG